MHKLAKQIMDRVESKIKTCGIDGITEQELIEMKYWTCVADCMTSYDYHYKIIEEMEKPENKYGVNYDENGRFYTQPRNSMGQFTSHRGYEPDAMMHRDIDAHMGKMYYTEGSSSRNMNGNTESRYDRAKRGYKESKMMNPSTDHMSQIEEIMDVFEEDIRELKPKMTANEKTVAKNRLVNVANNMMSNG